MYRKLFAWFMTLTMLLSLLPATGLTALAETTPNYLTFTAAEDGSSVTFNYKSGSDVQTSTDGGETWTDYTKGTKITLAKGGKVCFKGTNVITNSSYHFSMTGTIAASGSVTSLTDGNGGNPGLTLASYCYSYMFYGCTNLTTAPELPATTLVDRCYQYMFYGCTNLTTAPELPATTLASYCYSYMFGNCVNLTTAPGLPATTLASYCYQYMFYSCTNLTTAPELPATILADFCYRYMFCDCSNLAIYENETDYIWSFPSSGAGNWNTNMLYGIKTGSVTKVELGKKYNIYPAHTHTYQYTASGATITGKCSESGCTKTGSYTVSYDSANQVAVVTGEITGVDTPTPVYYQGETLLNAAPAEPGDYTAKITVEGATASVNFTISGETPTHSQKKTFESKSKTECENQYLTFVFSTEKDKTYKSPQTIKEIFTGIWDKIEGSFTFHVEVTGLDEGETVTVDLTN